MALPMIGITVSQVYKNNQWVNHNPSAYAEAIVRAGGLPILIPNEFPLEQLPDLSSKIDGLMLSGGGDLDIRLFNGVPHQTISEVSEDRDRLEIALIRQALEDHKPIFGICRGIQVINVALGGTLYTHIPDQYNSGIDHSTPNEKGRDFIAHELTLNPDSKLGKIVGQQHFGVNSFHHQAILKTSPRFGGDSTRI